MTFSAPNYCRGVLIVRFGEGIEDKINKNLHLRNLYLDRKQNKKQTKTTHRPGAPAKYELKVVDGFTELLAGPSQ